MADAKAERELEGPSVTRLSVDRSRPRGSGPALSEQLHEPSVIARLIREPSERYAAARQLHLASWRSPALLHDHLPALLELLSTDNASVRVEALSALWNFSSELTGAAAITDALRGGLAQLTRQLIVATSATDAEAQASSEARAPGEQE